MKNEWWVDLKAKREIVMTPKKLKLLKLIPIVIKKGQIKLNKWK